MELKDPRKLAEELNASTQKIVKGINKNVKELAESKSLKEFVENVQEDFTEIQDLTKKMHENNLEEARSKVLEKTEELQEKLQQFHDYIENANNDSSESVVSEETATEEVIDETIDEPTEESVEKSNDEIITENIAE